MNRCPVLLLSALAAALLSAPSLQGQTPHRAPESQPSHDQRMLDALEADRAAVKPGSSAAARQDRKLKASYAIKNLGPFQGSGALVGTYLSPNQLFEMEASWLSKELHQRIFHLQHRMFWGNSFNTTAGLAANEITGRSYSYDVDTKSWNMIRGENSYDSSYLFAKFAIGNAWQWHSLGFGFDWVQSLIKLRKIRDFRDSWAGTSQDRPIRRDPANKDSDFYKMSHDQWGFLNFYLGWSL